MNEVNLPSLEDLCDPPTPERDREATAEYAALCCCERVVAYGPTLAGLMGAANATE